MNMKKFLLWTLILALLMPPAKAAAEEELPVSAEEQSEEEAEKTEEQEDPREETKPEETPENVPAEEENEEERDDAPEEETEEETEEEVAEEENEEEKEGEEEEEICDGCIFAEDSGLSAFLKGGDLKIRLAGKNRISTSLEISRFLREQSSTVIIADGGRYYDALSGGALTEGKYPVLLTEGPLNEATLAEISRLAPQRVYILGGKASVPLTVEEQLKSLGLEEENIRRFAGKDRYETSLLIAEYTDRLNTVLASGENFPDALAASSYAASIGADIVLTPKNPEGKVLDYLNESDGEITVVGGKASVDPENIPGNPAVLAGKNRYETAALLATYLEPGEIILASGENFPDALAISSVAAGLEAPILLTGAEKLPDETVNYLKEQRMSIYKLILVGGKASVSELAETNAKEILTTGSIQTVPLPKVDYELYENNDYVTADRTTHLSGGIEVPAGKTVKVISVDRNTRTVILQYNGAQGKAYRPEEFSASTVRNSNIDVPYISQLYPVYAPVGCEPTALLMGLHGKGYATDVGLRQFLNEMPKHDSNPEKGFAGTPYQGNESKRTTINPRPLAAYASKYGPVADISGSSMDDIIMELDNGNPVLIYVTLHWRTPYYRWYNIEGEQKKILRNNHGLLLTGYDKDKGVFHIADPYNNHNRRSEYYYDKARSVVEPLYNVRKYAVVIR